MCLLCMCVTTPEAMPTGIERCRWSMRDESRWRAPLAARQTRMAYMEERWLLATVDTKLACACVCISAVNQHP